MTSAERVWRQYERSEKEQGISTTAMFLCRGFIFKESRNRFSSKQFKLLVLVRADDFVLVSRNGVIDVRAAFGFCDNCAADAVLPDYCRAVFKSNDGKTLAVCDTLTQIGFALCAVVRRTDCVYNAEAGKANVSRF